MTQTIGPADVAVITGGASGIGLALGQAIAAKGGAVLLADIEGPKAEAAAQSIRDQGGAALGCFVDVADPASNQALADFAFERFGRVTVVFLNAGIGAGGSIHKASRANIAWTFEVNVMGTIDGVRAFAPRLLEQDIASRLVITASEHGLGLPVRGGQANTLYCLQARAGGAR
jgi:NAD(P)-dependent dehydrogenase (short-subunit alcohol dehydrogenase family)